MRLEQMKISETQIQQISDMLLTQGLTSSEINEFINGKYATFENDIDLLKIINFDGNYQNGRTKTILKGLLLSKERECYKGIAKIIERNKQQILSQQPPMDIGGKEL